MASGAGTGNIVSSASSTNTNTNSNAHPSTSSTGVATSSTIAGGVSNASNVAATASASAYDDLRRRLYHAHLAPTAPAIADNYAYHHHYNNNPNWQYAPSTYSYSSSSTVPYASPEYSHFPYAMGAPSASPSDAPKFEYADDQSYEHSSHHADGRIEMDQDEVDAIIRNKRKVRDPKACYACHRRKVKCDRNLPCDSCVKRDHPELCSYERPTKKKRIAINNVQPPGLECATVDAADVPVTSGPNLTVPKEQWERINLELQKLRALLSDAQTSSTPAVAGELDREDAQSLGRSDVTEREGIHAPSTQMGTMHLGSRSVLAYMMGTRSKSSQDAARLLLEENILPKLGLDNETATYPFVDLWSTDSSISDVNGLVRALPEDSLVQQFWVSYRDVACTIYPVVPDKQHFEKTLNYMLHQRQEQIRRGLAIDLNRPYGVSMPWLALVFAVLASGAQCGTLPAKERELTSQVYICCAYQALRMANFLTHPCLDTIEASLIIGNALAYNMNPGVAYIFLGMTLRCALSMGLHVNSQGFTEHENYLRGRIWWALAWQDSHFSVSYDRPSSSILCFPDIPHTRDSSPGDRSYVESMSALIKLTQEIVRDRALSPDKAMGSGTIQKYKDQVYRIITDATQRLKDRSMCRTVIEHMERCAFQLHFSYMLSEICRPALKESSGVPSSSSAMSPKNRRRQNSTSGSSVHSAPSPSSNFSSDPNVQAQLRAECVINLERTVEAYVDLHSHSVFPCRSWIGIQRSITAAFLLGIVPETQKEPRITQLLMELERCIAQRAAEDLPRFDSHHEGARGSSMDTDAKAPENEVPTWASSMTKSLHALRKLNAALAASNPPQTSGGHHQSRGYAPIQQGPQKPGGITYSSPMISPRTGNARQVPGNSTNLGASTAHMNTYSAAHLQPSQAHQHTSHHLGSPTHGQTGVYVPQRVGMAPVTPDSVASGGSGSGDWHYGNLSEHAMEYVQPGLWG